MTSLKRRLGATAVPLLLALTLTACGDDDAAEPDAPGDTTTVEPFVATSIAPTDASKDDFCGIADGLTQLPGDYLELEPDEKADLVLELLGEVRDRFAEIGTPADISPEQREGFELSLQRLQGVDEADARAAIAANENPFEQVFDGDQEAKVDAFDTWADDYCGRAPAS